MPSPEVIEALETLHKELDKLAPALKHVESAMEVTKTVKLIPEKHLELINQIRNIDESYKTDLAKQFSVAIESVKLGNTSMISELNNILKKIEIHHSKVESLTKQIEEYHTTFLKVNFPDRLDKVDITTSGINIGVQNLQTSLMNTSTLIQETRKNIFDLIEQKINSLNDKLDKQHNFNSTQFNKINKFLIISICLAALTALLLFIFKYFKYF